MPPLIGDGAHVPIEGGVQVCGRKHEAGIQDRHTAIRQGEEGGSGPAQREGGGLSKEKRRGVNMNGDREEGPPPATREAGPGNPGGAQGTRAAETTMVKLAAT